LSTVTVWVTTLPSQLPTDHIATRVDACPAAGVIALDLARELLELHPNKIALVVSHENM
jgi:hypothetical protein